MRHGFLIPILLLIAAIPAGAQDATQRFERQLEDIRRQSLLQIDESIPADQRILFDYGGMVNFAFLAVDDPSGSTHILRQSELAGFAHLNLDGAHDFFVRARMTYQDFNAGDDFNGRGDDAIGPNLDRAYYTFDWGKYLAAYEGEDASVDFSITAGRQLVHWVNGLALSRDIDGLTGTLEIGKLTLTGLAGVTRQDTFDIDPARPNFDDDTNRAFFGGMAAYQLTPNHRPFIYGFAQRDHNDHDPQSISTETGSFDSRFDYDSHYIGAGSTGRFSDQLIYSVEAVVQGGRGLSSAVEFDDAGVGTVADSQTQESIEAWALDARLDYLFHDERHTRAVLEAVLASGDSDRSRASNSVIGGNQTDTSDRGYNGFGLVNTGLAFFPTVSNLVLVRAGVATFPFPSHGPFRRLQVGGDLLVFHKMDSDAPINEPTGDGSYLGSELDFFANWQVTSDVAIVLRYGVFFPGDAMTSDGSLGTNDGNARHFFFTGVTYAF